MQDSSRIKSSSSVEYQHIGVRYESTLHAELREWYSLPDDIIERKIDSYIIDIVRGDLLIEIQTSNFSSINRKLRELLKNHKVQLVHPLVQEKWILKIDRKNEMVYSKRKSPKREVPSDIFNELVYLPDIINEPAFSLVVVMIVEEEIWCNDGRGSWLRKGMSIVDRKLVSVKEVLPLRSTDSFLSFLPNDLPKKFTNKILATSAGVPIRKAQKMTYCLKKMGAIVQTGKIQNELQFSRSAGSTFK